VIFLLLCALIVMFAARVGLRVAGRQTPTGLLVGEGLALALLLATLILLAV